ncbi:hypothetical protein PTMSG1_08516 [Pyrenophora teres f. maculata]|nr:hypothetical protein PTMSG1_08516 [Pyrenophora teres f. maculata]
MSHPFGEPHAMSEAEKSSDEEIWDEMDKKDLSYRLGWPNLTALPLTMIMPTPTNRLPNEPKHLQYVKNVLSANKITVTEIHFLLRVPKWEESEQNRDHMTLLVLCDTEKSTRTHLKTTIMELRQYFKGLGGPEDQLKIEFLDFRALHDQWTLPLGPNDTIVNQWPDVLESLIAELARLKERWLSIELCHRGLYNDTKRCLLTVVITTPSAKEDEHWWTQVLPYLRTSVTSPFVFKYEVLYGKSLYAMDTTWGGPEYRMSESWYDKELCMGPSIGIFKGPRHAGTAGTAGGVVTLGNKGSFALTNFHVVTDNRIDAMTKGTHLSPAPKELRSNPQVFVSPADIDHRAYIALLESRKIAMESKPITKGSTADEARNSIITQLAKLREEPRAFGALVAGSGRMSAKAPKFMTDETTGEPNLPPSGEEEAVTELLWPMDWALIRLLNGRSMANMMSKEKLASGNVPIGGTSLPPGGSAKHWTALNAGACDLLRDNVNAAKYGRTTGWTFGVIDRTLVGINPEEGFKKIAEKYGYTEDKHGYAWGLKKRRPDHPPVFTGGDSGSICVHDPSGTWLGLLFGETAIGTGLLLPIDVVFKDIERVTGQKVTDPTWCVVSPKSEEIFAGFAGELSGGDPEEDFADAFGAGFDSE